MSSARKTTAPVDDATKLDLETPRMLAAMKVTGIHPSDLEEPPPLSSKDAQNEAALRRLDLMDRKRRQLIRQLEETAKSLDDTLVEYFLSPATAEAAHIAAEQHEFLLREKGNIDKKRERVKAEIMKELKAEMERKQAHENRKKAQEEFTKAMHQKHVEHVEEMTKKSNDRAAHFQKIEERGRGISKEEMDKRKDTKKKFMSDEKGCEAGRRSQTNVGRCTRSTAEKDSRYRFEERREPAHTRRRIYQKVGDEFDEGDGTRGKDEKNFRGQASAKARTAL
jgi:hypothetical protein